MKDLSPEYAVCKAIGGKGLLQTLDRPWKKINKATKVMCKCKGIDVHIKGYKCSYDEMVYHIGQCNRCLKIYWF